MIEHREITITFHDFVRGDEKNKENCTGCGLDSLFHSITQMVAHKELSEERRLHLCQTLEELETTKAELEKMKKLAEGGAKALLHAREVIHTIGRNEDVEQFDAEVEEILAAATRLN